jgi:hypothetical protein
MKIVEKLGGNLRGVRKHIADWRRKMIVQLRSSVSRGQSFMIWAIAFMGLIAFVGFVVDTGLIYLHQVWLGQAVDAASLAAGHELPNIRAACARAVEYLEANGYAVGPDFAFQIIYPEWPDAPDPPGNPGIFLIDSIDDNIIDPEDCASITFDAKHTSMHFEVEIAATQEISLMFMHLLGFGNVNVGAPALAERSFIYDIVLILDRSGSMRYDTCSRVRPADDYGCENRYDPCVGPFFAEDFQDDDNLADVASDGWVLVGDYNVEFNSTQHAIDMSCSRAPPLEDPAPFEWDFICQGAGVGEEEIWFDNVIGYTNVLLDHCIVTGEVQVANGHLYAHSSRIEGNVVLRDSYLLIDKSTVTGNLDPNTIFFNNVGYVITNNVINGNVKLAGGGFVRLIGNTIDGNLDINCPTVVVEKSGNVVDGVTDVCSDPPGGKCAAIYGTIDTVGYDENVTLFFTLEETNLDPDDAFEVFWRPNAGVGWSQIAEYSEADIPDGVMTRFGVVLPSAAYDNPNLQIRFVTDNGTEKWLTLDNIELRTCTDRPGPWIWYQRNSSTACYTTRPMRCETDDPDSLMPGVSISGASPPLANLIEQPMMDVILAAETFIDLIDSRRPPLSPRNDYIGLVGYNHQADKLFGLSTDYEAIKQELYDFQGRGSTNLGGGIRVGLDILADGRWNSTHYMILLTDGWPNVFDDSTYVSPTRFSRSCGSSNPCRQTLEYIDAQVRQANLNNVTIFTIGLGADLDTRTFTVSGVPGWADGNYSGMDILERIADGTNGQAYHAPSTEELEEIFAWIAEAIFIRITR